ncbi:MAG: S46 family peptidase [Myxococcota bacterium]
MLKLLPIFFIIFIFSGCQTKNKQNNKNSKQTKSSNTSSQLKINSTAKNSSSQSKIINKIPQYSGEGMWPWFDLDKLSEEKLRKRGMQIPLEKIWKKGKGGLARAVVGMRGCTASFISKDGLLITNHHCAFGAIARNSTKEKNLLQNGFLAHSKKEELDGQGTSIWVFLSQKDVTSIITKAISANTDDLKRNEIIEKREKMVVEQCEQKPNRKCWISRENHGLRYLLMENLEIKDVRLVAAPPRSIGAYGGEIDNWHWPRHSLDFALMRAYVDKDGKPAEFAQNNNPYQPEEYLKISKGNLNEDDFIMVLGTPYRTSRYSTVAQLRKKLNWYFPFKVNLFSRWVSTLENIVRHHSDTKLAVETMIKRLHNGLTNSRGQIKGIKRNRLLAQKQQFEEKWKKWVETLPDKKKKEKYLESYKKLNQLNLADKNTKEADLLLKYFLYGIKTAEFAYKITRLAQEKTKPDLQREKGYMKRDEAKIYSDLKHGQKSLALQADKAVFVLFLKLFDNLPEDQRIKWFDKKLQGDYSEDNINKLVDLLLNNTALFDLEKRMKIAKQPFSQLKNSSDPMIKMALELNPRIKEKLQRKKTKAGALQRIMPVYLSSIMEFEKKNFYPDANASPRISFAHVSGYSPKDGVWYLPFTTLSGMKAKATGKPPFVLSKKIKAFKAGKSKYFSKYLADIPICFMSNADTTGGNSGSPVLDAKGRFTGLNFDRVYHNISGDFGYNPARSRNIMVHVNSILWYLDEIMKGKNILQEIKTGA